MGTTDRKSQKDESVLFAPRESTRTGTARRAWLEGMMSGVITSYRDRGSVFSSLLLAGGVLSVSACSLPDVSGARMPAPVALIGAGFIGTRLIRRLLAAGQAVRVIDRHPCPAAYAGMVQWRSADYQDSASLAEQLAGVGTVVFLVRRSSLCADGLPAVVAACEAFGVTRLVFVSSAAVYGRQETLPIPETAALRPRSAYAREKCALEWWLRTRLARTRVQPCIVRLANPYGPGQRSDAGQGIVAIALQALRGGALLPLRGSGTAMRDFIHVDDVAEGLWHLATMPTPPPLLNLGSGEGHRVQAILRRLERLTGQRLRVRTLPEDDSEIPVSVLDIGLARAAFGFAPRIGIHEGLRMLVESETGSGSLHGRACG
jgi:UDP-glucose 4-epimerase